MVAVLILVIKERVIPYYRSHNYPGHHVLILVIKERVIPLSSSTTPSCAMSLNPSHKGKGDSMKNINFFAVMAVLILVIKERVIP